MVKPGGSHASAVVSGGWEYDRRASEIRQMLVTALRPNEPGSPIVILRPKVAPSPAVSLGPNAPGSTDVNLPPNAIGSSVLPLEHRRFANHEISVHGLGAEHAADEDPINGLAHERLGEHVAVDGLAR